MLLRTETASWESIFSSYPHVAYTHVTALTQIVTGDFGKTVFAHKDLKDTVKKTQVYMTKEPQTIPLCPELELKDVEAALALISSV